ncbi:hypothetical protein N8Z47_03715 [Salibacteraceae bacterium]|nr:hypothetical protein [Salibacteraceae bacterium]
MMRNLTIFSVFTLALNLGLFAQEDSVQIVQDTPAAAEKKTMPSGDLQRADRLFFDENYQEAMLEYALALEKDQENTRINYNLGLCYLNSDYEKEKAIPYFEKVLFYDEESATVHYLMGKVYQFEMRFDRAIEQFNQYIQYRAAGDDFSEEEAEIEIEYCENAYQLVKFPKECVYENLGDHINSPYPDYFPFVTADESFLVFTSKRNDGSQKIPDGTYASNIYYSRVEDGEYTDAIKMPGADNEPGESEVVIGMESTGENMLLMKGLESITGDIYEAEFSNDHLENVKALGERINSEKSREIAATYGTDRNSIYFVSDRDGGYGGTDIWIVKRLPTGAWGLPYNAGPSINTERDEGFPNISPDGSKMFFSSKGHFSMGGFDIFEAKWDADSNSYVNPRNLGYPINSVDDDMNYRESNSGRYGYISALRPEGQGDYDLYRLTIAEVESEYSVIRGVLTSKGEIENAQITVTNLADPDELGYYFPNASTMRYVIILAPGNYDVFIEADGMEPVAFEVKILGKSSFQSEIVRDIELIRK